MARLISVLCGAWLTVGCAASPDLAAEFNSWESELLAKGYLRTARTPADAPFDNRALNEHFAKIAFGVEADLNEGRSDAPYLARWTVPLRWHLFAPTGEAEAARGEVAAFTARLAALAGRDIAEAEGATAANLDILLVGPERFEAARHWAAGRFAQSEVILRMLRTFEHIGYPCVGQIFYDQADDTQPQGSIVHSIVLIRQGLTDLGRLSCIEEELAQVMGLRNDHDDVRPSIFNDDEEFALLTRHDEYLLTIRGLRPG